MLAEGSRRPDQRVGPLNLQFRREPWPPQHTSLRPLRRGKIMPCGQMLSQCRQQCVPSIIADWDWLVPQQRRLNVVWFPPVFFQELPHEFPSHFDIRRPRQAVSEVSQSHGMVAGHESPPLGDHLDRAYDAGSYSHRIGLIWPERETGLRDLMSAAGSPNVGARPTPRIASPTDGDRESCGQCVRCLTLRRQRRLRRRQRQRSVPTAPTRSRRGMRLIWGQVTRLAPKDREGSRSRSENPSDLPLQWSGRPDLNRRPLDPQVRNQGP